MKKFSLKLYLFLNSLSEILSYEKKNSFAEDLASYKFDNNFIELK